MIEKNCEIKVPILSPPIAVGPCDRIQKRRCKCLDKIDKLTEEIHLAKDQTARNTRTIEDRYDFLTEQLLQMFRDHNQDVQNINNNINVNTENLEYLIQQESNRAQGAEQTLQSNIDTLRAKHNSDMSEMNSHIDDIVGIDAQGVSEIKAILSDNDAATGIITELAKKATIVDLQAEIDRSTGKDTSHDTSIQDLQDNKANKSDMTAGTYRSVTVNNQGIVTAGSNPTTASGYGISDVYTKAEIDSLLLALTNRISTLESYWAPKTIEQETFLSTTYKIDTQGYR